MEALFTKQRFLIVLPIVLLLIAWNRGADLLYLLGFLAAATAIFAHVLPLVQLRGVVVERETAAVATELAPASWAIAVRNTTWWPRYMLEVADRVPPALKADFEPRLGVGYLGPRAHKVVRGVVCFPRRGVYRLGPLALESAFPVGLLPRRRVIDRSSCDVVVYPELFEVKRLVLPEAGVVYSSAGTPTGQPGGDTDFWGLREYRRGDSPRRIHWAASARHGELVVKEFERQGTSRRLMLVLDQNRAFNVGSGRESTFEYAVRISGSIARYALDAGWEVGMVGHGKDPFELAPSRLPGQHEAVLGRLARVECDGNFPLAGAVSRARVLNGAAGMLVLFSNAGMGGAASVSAYAPEQPVIVVAFDRASFTRAEGRSEAPSAPVRHHMNVIYLVKRGDALARVFA